MARKLTQGGETTAAMTELEIQMKCGTPERCILLAHSAPSVQMFYALRMRLETSTDAWLREFLNLDGLDSLLDSMCQMTGKGFTSFSDAILQLDCISCIRVILNTNIGLDFMVRNDTYTPKLALGMSTAYCQRILFFICITFVHVIFHVSIVSYTCISYRIEFYIF